MLCISFSCCSDYDGVQKKWNIDGKITISKIENYGFDLYFNISDTWSTPIEGNLPVVYYDSANNVIFAASDEYINEYYKIEILNSKSDNLEHALTKSKISHDEFKSSINKRMKKWDVKDWNR